MKAKRKTVVTTTAFWDTSAIVPLCCFQSQSAQARSVAAKYGRQVVWWTTAVEAVSAFNRLLREDFFTLNGKRQALDRLNYLRIRWSEIQPAEEVREIAERLLGHHKLRAADALQLAAALVWCSHKPRGRHWIGADGGLSAAAESEGFIVVHLM
jgi:predicted nucleic acid-binding protein